jgi:hypothetical protein
MFIVLGACCAAKECWSCTVVTLEGGDKVRGVGEATEPCYLRYGKVCSKSETIGEVETPKDEPSVGREAETTTKPTLKG